MLDQSYHFVYEDDWCDDDLLASRLREHLKEKTLRHKAHLGITLEKQINHIHGDEIDAIFNAHHISDEVRWAGISIYYQDVNGRFNERKLLAETERQDVSTLFDLPIIVAYQDKDGNNIFDVKIGKVVYSTWLRNDAIYVYPKFIRNGELRLHFNPKLKDDSLIPTFLSSVVDDLISDKFREHTLRLTPKDSSLTIFYRKESVLKKALIDFLFKPVRERTNQPTLTLKCFNNEHLPLEDSILLTETLKDQYLTMSFTEEVKTTILSLFKRNLDYLLNETLIEANVYYSDGSNPATIVRRYLLTTTGMWEDFNRSFSCMLKDNQLENFSDLMSVSFLTHGGKNRLYLKLIIGERFDRSLPYEVGVEPLKRFDTFTQDLNNSLIKARLEILENQNQMLSYRVHELISALKSSTNRF